MAFINENFMLNNETGKHLYHDFAKDMPIYDYHCHLDPKQISENVKCEDITELWLSGDHYKWRAMRAQGIEERYITGDAAPLDKFKKWAETLENSVGNPLYHWSQLELKMYFNIEDLLTSDNAEEIYHRANDYLKQHKVTTQSLITDSNVNLICTTDNPTDDLNYHDEIKAQDGFHTTVLPAFRPDDVFKIGDQAFSDLLEKLEKLTHKITSPSDFVEALYKRIQYFHDKGGRLADHGLEEIHFEDYTDKDIQDIFTKALNHSGISSYEQFQFQSYMLNELSKAYHQHGWVMQIHFGAIRNNNSKMFEKVGKDAGFDSIRDQENLAYHLNATLDMMEQESHLPKTILYNLNPIYNDIVGSTIANFQTEPGIISKVQHGAGWWFNDTKRGMLRQMSSLADQGLLMHFVGMLTDSRSFISYSRHDYFRRILSSFIGDLVEKGEIPNDDKLLKRMIENICYNNAYNYFKLI
ncbi:glucuronate isomerase [Staphylococcus haemolyticus]|uniref:glucuronate isomerase n=1 Tax=Staphylococcus haemolyticus TaxID=1283 RepID=UPI000D1F35C6|nr:glucuronate isomerase [Staphylococcus haemolyticus]MWF63652.1 glucuronate isomerase [Staphylococcus haemolyticus]PTK48750.1 glucuronate isomerase [Staphylococcus haemolyticus]PTK68642.1 glucuronate isomerase [Staphylococcus haemolyticus]PTK78716.1 glucuronate isomerase [Staphylococcus haemolyticus]